MTGPVVVGIDGSPAGMTAAWWGAHEAVDRNLPLLLVHSWTTQPLAVPVRQEALSKQSYGARVLRRAEAELLHRYAGLSLTTELVSDPAVQVLTDLSEDASILVLGSRGHGAVSSFLLGSISLHVLGVSHCPAVTVRAGDPAVEDGWGHAAAADRNTIVVGVQDAVPAVEPLLDFAFTTADVRGAPLCAVRAVPLPPLVPRPLAEGDNGGDLTEERQQLAELLAPWREKFPSVHVEEHTVRGSASQALLTTCPHVRLVVVGRRRHPSPLTWKLGPVAHAALHHVPCPVAVVPHD